MMASKQTGYRMTDSFPQDADVIYLYTCVRCEDVLGEGDNRWERLSRSYVLPVLPDSIFLSTIKVNQDIHRAAASDMEGCSVQTVNCKKCGSSLGLVCVEAPPAKHQYRDRVVFKLPKLRIVRAAKSGHRTFVLAFIIESGTPCGSREDHNSNEDPDRRENSQPNSQVATADVTHSNTNSIEDNPLGPREDVQEQLDGQAEDIERIMDMMENFKRDVDEIKGIIAQLQTEIFHSKPASSGPFAPAGTLQRISDTVGTGEEEVHRLKTEIMNMKVKIAQLEGETNNDKTPFQSPPPRLNAKVVIPIMRRSSSATNITATKSTKNKSAPGVNRNPANTPDNNEPFSTEKPFRPKTSALKPRRQAAASAKRSAPAAPAATKPKSNPTFAEQTTQEDHGESDGSLYSPRTSKEPDSSPDPLASALSLEPTITLSGKRKRQSDPARDSAPTRNTRTRPSSGKGKGNDQNGDKGTESNGKEEGKGTGHDTASLSTTKTKTTTTTTTTTTSGAEESTTSSSANTNLEQQKQTTNGTHHPNTVMKRRRAEMAQRDLEVKRVMEREEALISQFN